MLGLLSIRVLSHLATLGVAALCVALLRILGHDLKRAPRYLLENGRWILGSAALIVAAVTALLLAPAPPPGSHCVVIYPVWGPLEMVLSCDSYEFVARARAPEHLLAPRSWNQPRPLGVTSAALLTAIETAARGSGPGHRALPAQAPYDMRRHPGWLPYVLLNGVLLLVSTLLFRRLMVPLSSAATPLVALFCALLVFNDVVKGFFWSAHTQMWNVAMPLIAISLSHALLWRSRSWHFMAASGLLVGIGWLAYGSFVVCAAAAVAAIGLRWSVQRPRPPAGEVLGKAFLFLVAFAAPVSVWATLVRRVSGGFFSPEIEVFRQFVWVFDAWAAGGLEALVRQARGFASEFLQRLWSVSWPSLALLAVVGWLAIVAPERLAETIRTRRAMLAAAGITFVLCLGFFYLLGFYRNRLAQNVAIPVLVVAGVALTDVIDRLPASRARLVLALVAVVAVTFAASALWRVTWPY